MSHRTPGTRRHGLTSSATIAFATLAGSLLLAACAGPVPQLLSKPPARPDAFARLRGHDAYGLVVSLGSGEIAPNLREVERCASRDEACEVLQSEAGRYQYAAVKLSGSLGIDRMVVVKGLTQVGDIVRFTMPIDPTIVPMSFELGARAARRKGSGCDWVDGTPETKTGGVVCKGWSYRQADAPGAGQVARPS